ncbi:MAG: DUF354 domain-containing protein [Bacteroidales bacterium]|nr:DUF354 domain-containing protein [Bacteroidales bacterium]
MNILIDIGHPGHVHLFKNFANKMMGKGHAVLFTCRQKEFEVELLEKYKLPYVSFGKHKFTILGKAFGLVQFNCKLLIQSIKFKPDLFLSHGSMYAAQVAWLLRKPHISFEDTGNLEQIRLYLPFSKYVLTSDSFHKNLGKKQIKYSGYHELAYLHPNQFTPDESVLKIINCNKEDRIFILRLVSWNASHDKGQSGITKEMVHRIITILNNAGRIFISSEAELPEDLKKFKLILPPEKIHHVLYYANLLITEGATMASECAMLGTPAIYVNSITAGTLEDQEKYGLLFGFRNDNGVLEKLEELINTKDLKKLWQVRRDKMLKDKIDLTEFLIWFVENYPKSVSVMKENPEYQYTFR